MARRPSSLAAIAASDWRRRGSSWRKARGSRSPDATGSGILTVHVDANESFGFYVDSLDSTGGAGYLAINQDLVLPSAPPPPPPPAIPEPQTPVLMLAGLAALFAAARRRSSADE